jgi:hypothetical protein
VRLETPAVLKGEHTALTLELESASVIGGRIGDAARRLMGLMAAHLKREEEWAFPLLSLLPHLAAGTVGEEMEVALPIADRLRRELSRLRQEHVAIVEAVEDLAEAARREGRDHYSKLAHELLEHARFEEAVLYPAALVVGEYVRLRMKELKSEGVSSASARTT